MKDKAILVVSFGTTNKAIRKKTIDLIELKIQNIFPHYKIYRAFTSKVIIEKIKTTENIKINTVSEAIKKIISDGITNLIVQPTHIINGIENNNMINDIKMHINSFHSIKIGDPLLSSQKDCINIINIIKKQLFFTNFNEGIILMGHGTSHYCDKTYTHFNNIIKSKGYQNIYVATMKGSLKLSDVITDLKNKSIKKVHLVPIMFHCGKHIICDMNGSKDSSWKNILKRNGFDVNCILKGLSEYPEIQDLLVDHITKAKAIDFNL